jgi:hypothetical protein
MKHKMLYPLVFIYPLGHPKGSILSLPKKSVEVFYPIFYDNSTIFFVSIKLPASRR